MNCEPRTAAAREALRALALASPALMFVLVYVGDEYRKPLRTTPVFLALGVLALWLGRPRVPSSAPPPSPSGFWARGSDRWGLRVVAVASFVLLAVLLSRRPYQGMVLYHLRGTGLWTAVTIAAAGLALVLARPPRPWIVLGILIAGDLAVRAFSLRQWEIHPAVRDMLPLVMSAIDSFLAGENPYAVHTMQIGSQVPLTYPPAMWLAYLPARLAGIDIRWTSWLADAVVAVALAWPAVQASGFGLRASGRSDASSGPAVPNPGPTWPALLFAATYLFLPDTHWNGIYAEPNVDWAVVAVLTCCLATGRPLAAGAALGVAIAMRPLNFALVPLLAAGLWRVHGPRAAARSILLAAAVSAVLYVPFVLRDPDAFFLGAVRWLIEYGPAHRTWFHGMLGFSGPLYEARLEAWMHPAQIAGIAGALGLTAWRARSARGVLAGCAAAYSVLVAFSPLVWMSFWIGAVILVSAAVGVPRSDPKSEIRNPKSEIRTLAGLAAAAALAAYLGVLLARHFSEDGRAEVREAILSRATAGDLVIDRTGPRIAFLDFPHVVGPRDLPPGVTLAEDPFSAVAPRRRAIEPGEHARVLAVDRFDLFDTELAALSGPYRPVSEERFGRFRLIVLERRVAARPLARLSADVRGLDVSMETDAGAVAAVWRDDAGGRWWFEGMPDWQAVGRQDCAYRGFRTSAVWAHPRAEGPLVIRMPLPAATRRVMVTGGLTDGAAEWGRAPVDVRVSFGRIELARLTFPNEPGRRGFAFELPAGGSGPFKLRVTTPHPGRRHFCLDLAAWE